MANQNQPTKIFRWIRIPTVSGPSFFISTSLYFPDIPLHIILPFVCGFKFNDIYIRAIIRHKNVIAKIVDEGLIGKQYQCNIIVSKNGSIEIHATDNHIGGTSLRLNIHRMRRGRWGIFPEHIPPKLAIEIQKCNFTGTRTFEIYVPIEYSLSTTITIGLSDVEQDTTIKAWIYYGGQQIKYIENSSEITGAWTKAINISREYVKGTWRLKISAPEYVLLDKYQISITTRTDPTKYDTDGDGMGDGKEVKGIDVDGVKIWTNPLLKDTDMDGLSDSKELSIGTNPLSKDTDADGIIDSQDKAPTGNRLLEIRIGEVKVELYKKYVWRYLFGESWGSDRWMEDTLFCVIIDTKYNAFILPYLYGKGRANYQNNPETKAYYVDIPDNVESTTIRLALYIKSGYTTFWIWWHKALEKRVGLSGDWDTLEEKRDVRHINLGFYEEWLRTETQLEYMAKTYPQTFTKIYMVTKPDFVVKPDTEYVVIIMRVDGEFRTIACPREIFLETKLGDIIMETNDDALVAMGLEDADISGFSEGKISPYVYGLITKSDATSTIWNKVVAAITQNTSGVRIASIVQMSRILLPKDIVKMIPLNVLPQQGKSLPEYMSPEASIWAAMVGFVTEVGRLLCELFMALANFLAKLIETIVEWGLKLLGALLEVLSVAKYLFAMALCVWSWVEAAKLILIFAVVSIVVSLLSDFLPIPITVGPLGFSLDLSFGSSNVVLRIGIDSVDYYGFPIAHVGFFVCADVVIFSCRLSMSFDLMFPLVPFIESVVSVLEPVVQVLGDDIRFTRFCGDFPNGSWSYRVDGSLEPPNIFELSLDVFLSTIFSGLITQGITIIALTELNNPYGWGAYIVGLLATILYSWFMYFDKAIDTLFDQYYLLGKIFLLTSCLSIFMNIVLNYVLRNRISENYRSFIICILCSLASFCLSWVLSSYYNIPGPTYTSLLLGILATIVVSIILDKIFYGEREVISKTIMQLLIPLFPPPQVDILDVWKFYVKENVKLPRRIEVKLKAEIPASVRLRPKRLAILTAVACVCLIVSAFGLELYARDRVWSEIELNPPQITPNTQNWILKLKNNVLNFGVNIEENDDRVYTSDAGTIRSRIMDFGIIVLRRGGETSLIKVTPYKADPLTKQRYHIPINITELIGEPATVNKSWMFSWNGSNHEYSIISDHIHGSGWLIKAEDKYAFINGSIVFDDWEPEKYYIIVWAVDEWGNARWVCYEANNISDSSTSSEKFLSMAHKSVWNTEVHCNMGYHIPRENIDLLSLLKPYCEKHHPMLFKKPIYYESLTHIISLRWGTWTNRAVAQVPEITEIFY